MRERGEEGGRGEKRREDGGMKRGEEEGRGGKRGEEGGRREGMGMD